ncbi:TetR/AcrR family transcriptional regulator [Halorussus caseinilyticus]|uniref:TetR/AcrR family transcriptional regulator n=1 Tax=Halorussus caseinilyticus TaxID=3034025 RepID=A0ABD5WK57_9EURY|nr:TetR/AcrR family transcriptional regulator [Halorussus sp. DT72]
MTASKADETTEDIVEATYCALCECGYAGLTMQDIADRSEASKSSLHYHYDTKHDLLLAFLDHLFESFADRFETDSDADPLDRFGALVDEVLDDSDDEARRDFRTAMLEIKAQAPYDEAFRERLTEFDDHVRECVRSVVADGVESGVFRADADPEATAEFVATVFDGAHTRAISTDSGLAHARRALADYVERDLLADGVDREVEFA